MDHAFNSHLSTGGHGKLLQLFQIPEAIGLLGMQEAKVL